MQAAPAYTIRTAAEADAPALRRIAQLDSQRPLTAPALVAELGGDAAAAISLADGRVVADPFQYTAVATQALRARSDALQAQLRTPSPAERIRKALLPSWRRTGNA